MRILVLLALLAVASSLHAQTPASAQAARGLTNAFSGDKLVPLAPLIAGQTVVTLLETLRVYWRWMKPQTDLLPGTVEELAVAAAVMRPPCEVADIVRRLGDLSCDTHRAWPTASMRFPRS